MPRLTQSSSVAPLDGLPVSQLVDGAKRIVDRTRAALVKKFGWTHLEVSIIPKPAHRCLDVVGIVLLPQTAAALTAEIAAALPAGWTPRSHLGLLAARGWRALPPGVTTLTRHAPFSVAPPERATELLQHDGPVRVVASVNGGTLVRAVDGTLGWTDRRLGPAVPPPGSPAHPSPDIRRFAAALRSYVGVPYSLGGATRLGIDCSALVQRCLRDTQHRIVPRHSTDQRHAAGAPARPLGEPGDIVFTWSKARDAHHVGVVLQGARSCQRVVIHASTTSRLVVEEPLDPFAQRADVVSHAEFAQIFDSSLCLPHR